jgi:hypothetical protein
MLLGKQRIAKLTKSPIILLVTANRIISDLHKTPLLQGSRPKEGLGTMNKTLMIIIGVLGGVMVILLAVVFVLVLQNARSSDGDATVTAAVAIVPPESTLIMGEASPTPPAGQMPATFTPLPTVEATNTAVPVTPDPTETPLPTNTLPPPTATRTPVPVILPTNPPPPPADTPVPPPPPPDTRGLTATAFNIQSRSDFRVNQQVWFDFQIVNSTGGEVAYNRLGVLPKKDGQDRLDWFQQSYGGPNATMKPQGLSHEDNIKLPEAGNYTLRLAICFDGYESCNSGGGTWATLSPEIPITIN